METELKIAKVRTSMHLLVERLSNGKTYTDRIEVREMKDGVRLTIDMQDNDVGKDQVILTLHEARSLASMLNEMARKVAKRPSYKP
jgi:hypothetical protein